VFASDEELAKTLVRTLEPVVGADHVRASVHVEYDPGTSEETQETYDPKTTTPLTTEHSEESSTGTAPAGVPGTASNVPAPTAPPPTPPAAGAPATPAASTASSLGTEQSNSKSEATTYAISKSLHRTMEPAGRVRRIAAAVLVDDAVDVADVAGKRTSTRRKRTPDEMKQLQQLASAAIGLDTQRGDVLAVENISFQELPLDIPAAPSKWEKWRRLLEPWLWTLRYLGIVALFLVVYFLILRPVKKQAVAAFKELPGKTAKGKAAALSAGGAAGSLQEGQAENQGSPEVQRATDLKKMLTEKVKAEPAAASRLVESWVREEDRS
jgi:flagellar M-ring protein FliF